MHVHARRVTSGSHNNILLRLATNSKSQYCDFIEVVILRLAGVVRRNVATSLKSQYYSLQVVILWKSQYYVKEGILLPT